MKENDTYSSDFSFKKEQVDNKQAFEQPPPPDLNKQVLDQLKKNKNVIKISKKLLKQ